MTTTRLTMAQALVKFLDNQYIEVDGVQSKFVAGVFTIFGHGNVLGLGQALEALIGFGRLKREVLGRELDRGHVLVVGQELDFLGRGAGAAPVAQQATHRAL